MTSHWARLLALFAFSLLAIIKPAQANYLWLEQDQGGVHGYWGLYETERLNPAGLAATRAFLQDGADLSLKRTAGSIEVATSANQDVRLSAQSVSDGAVLNFYQARFGRQETKAVNDLELVPTSSNGNTFKLVWKGTVVAASQVNVTTSAGWIRTLKPAEDGSVSLETPFPGLYVLEVTARVNGNMTYQGKKFEDVRHTATLSFVVPAAAASVATAAEAQP